MSNVRHHYMTLCFRDNTEITHIKRGEHIEISFEQACNNGFKTLICDENSNVLSNEGFNNSEVDYFLRFLKNNIEVIKAESNGEL